MLNRNKRFSRSNTIFNTKLRGLLKANNKNIPEEAENKSNDLSVKNEPQTKNEAIHKKQHSDDNNLININYKTEFRLQKKKKDEDLEIEIDKLVKKLLSKEITDEMKDESSLIYLLMNGPNKYKGDNKNKDKLIEIMKYLLEKHQKNERDILIIKTFILKIDKLVSLFESSNITKFEIIINKLSNQLKFEEYKENNIICKEGDRGEKLYISLKGESDVLIQKEGKDGECTKFEYIKYLIILYLYQEMNMITKIIYYNKQEMKVEERCILTLFIVFRFYKYFKDYNFYLSTSKKRYDQSNIFEFVINEKKVKDFIYKKYDYPVEDSVNIFEYSHKLIKELFHFYENQIKEINEKYEDKIDDSFEDIMNKKPTIFFKPTDLKELSTYAEYHRAKIRRNKKLKENEDILNKINSITEIPKKIIYNDNIKSYIERTDFNNILRYIKENQSNFNGISLNLKEAKQPIKYFYYSEVNLIKEGNIFGELALNNKNKKRTATIIAKKECYFAVLSKKVYDSYIKVAQIKSRIRKVLFFTEGPIFKGITPANFLNEFYFRIKRLECHKGKILFNKGSIRNKAYFIVKGEFEISAKLTLNDIGEMIEKLGGMCDNKKEKYLCNLYDEFNNYYFNKQMNIKFFVLKKNEIIGLDDMVLNDIHLFDCKCISVDESEIYEYEYKKYEEALRDNETVNKNNANFVNMRRKLLIENLFEQRNSLVELEYKKIKMEEEMKKKLSHVDLTKKINILNTLMKKVEYNDNDKTSGPIAILEKYKKKRRKKLHLDDISKNNDNDNSNDDDNSANNSQNNNSKDEIKGCASSKNNLINLNKFSSEKNIMTKNLLDKENGDKNSGKLGKKKSMYFPKIMSEKNLKLYDLGNLGRIFDKNKNINNINNIINDKDKILKEKEKKNEVKYNNLQINTKNTENFKLKIDKIINSQKDFDAIYNFKKSSYYMSLSSNSCNNFFKSLNPNNILPKTVEKRRKRNIIPISTTCKMNLNKKRLQKNAKLGFRIPSLFKEYYKEYKTTKTRISNVDDFYLDHQENLFSVLSQRNAKDKKIKKNEIENRNGNKKKGFRKNKISIKIKSKNDYAYFSDSKKRDKGVMTSYKVKSVPRNVGIIDFLCLDNWAEKTQFENKYFN